MDNFLSGGIAQLQEAKAAILDAERLAGEAEEAERLLKANEKDIEAQKKFMNDKINASIKNRQEELAKAHDDEIQAAKKEAKAAQRDKKNALNKAVNERITDETSALVAENKRIKKQISKTFHEVRIPTSFNTGLYYALFHPKSVKEFLIFALAVLITIAGIPNLVCALLDVSTIAKVFIYIGIVLLFVAIYFIIFSMTRGEVKAAAIEKGRQLRKRIAVNKTHIKSTSNSIKSEGDESIYGLGEFDAKIEQASTAVTDKETAKQSALDEFNESTAAAIRSEIEKENLPVIEQLEADGTALRADLTQKTAAAEQAKIRLSDTYASYLGAKNATPEKIDRLIAIISEGKAETVMQALDVLNTEI